MNRIFASGLLLATGGVAGYLVGVEATYPGRAFSLTALMLGITFIALSTGEVV